MSDQRDIRTISDREIRESEIQMTESPPVATGFIGFVPELPPGYTPLTSPLGETVPAASENGGDSTPEP